MTEDKTRRILKIISEPDITLFLDKVEEFKKEKEIVVEQYSSTAIPVQGNRGLEGIMSIPSCLIIYKATEDEFYAYKNKLNIITT